MKTVSSNEKLSRLLTANNTYMNLPASVLIEKAVANKEGILSETGALSVETGTYTGRSPNDKFIVMDIDNNNMDWGSNQSLNEGAFSNLYNKVIDYMENLDKKYVFRGYAGADQEYRLPIQVITEYAWHNLFSRQLFIRPESDNQHIDPAFTVISAPGLKADPEVDGTNSETFIVISFKKKVVLIGGTQYAGEIKKSIFTVMNYLLPEKDVFSMHCSANVGNEGDVALFFGLSGTGKTTLSNAPDRFLIGDDEHGWSDKGVFNIEGGCYAKTINLSKEKEPQIWDSIRFGSVLENVYINEENRKPDYNNNDLTENTRAAYPIEHVNNALNPGIGGTPNTIVFLTADAFGVLPPISKLTKEQAMYHFLSGYTSKLAGTERGVTKPQATFSTCFGAPFLPLKPKVYAEMLGERIEANNAEVYLVNTGWVGGPYGEGERIKLGYTRSMVQAALNGELKSVETATEPHFGLAIPLHCPGVPDDVLQPHKTWGSKAEYDKKAESLAARFASNFNKFDSVSDVIVAAGPSV